MCRSHTENKTTETTETTGLSASRRQLGRLSAEVGTSGYICTAAAIAPQYLLTAAHCIYLNGTGLVPPLNTTYAAGQKDLDVTPYGVVSAQQSFVPTGYSTRVDRDPGHKNYSAYKQWDWAVIKLQSAVGAQVSALTRAAPNQHMRPLDLMCQTAAWPSSWHGRGCIVVPQ